MDYESYDVPQYFTEKLNISKSTSASGTVLLEQFSKPTRVGWITLNVRPAGIACQDHQRKDAAELLWRISVVPGQTPTFSEKTRYILLYNL